MHRCLLSHLGRSWWQACAGECCEMSGVLSKGGRALCGRMFLTSMTVCHEYNLHIISQRYLRAVPPIPLLSMQRGIL